MSISPVATRQVATAQVLVGQTALHVLKGGAGQPCLVLHGIEGHEGWLALHDSLAEQATVYAPSHPGYGHTSAPDWISSVRHQAVFYNWFLQAAGLESVDLVGIGVGGWIAAEMAVMSAAPLRHLALVAAAGVRPEHDEIFDIFVVPWRQVIDRGFASTEVDEYARIYGGAPVQDFGGPREAGRIMSMKMCFKPYMYDPALPGMLGKIQVPTLIVWGREDQIIPVECADLYQRAIPGSSVRIIDECGHFAHLEQPLRLAGLLRDFFAE